VITFRPHEPSTGAATLCLPSSHAFRKIQLSVMPLRWRGLMGMSCSTHSTATYQSRWLLFVLTTIWLAAASAMTQARIAELRQETVAMFYHGFDNYMRIAFPEDEVKSPPKVKREGTDQLIAASCNLCSLDSRPAQSTKC
jgi:hypothetical protein